MGVYDRVRFRAGHMLENETGTIISVHGDQARVILEDNAATTTTVWAKVADLIVIERFKKGAK